MKAIDPRLLRHARAARSYLVLAVLLGLAVTALILAQAALLAHAPAAAARVRLPAWIRLTRSWCSTTGGHYQRMRRAGLLMLHTALTHIGAMRGPPARRDNECS